MKVLMAHNFYQQPGGEDKCFAAESDLLSRNGQDLLTYTVHNDAIDHMTAIGAACAAVWNRTSYRDLTALIGSEKPDIVHFHNTFPLMSPAAVRAAKAQGCAVVATLHNFRLFCPAGTFVRDGRICEDCAGRRLPWPGIVHGCYRNSRPASAVIASTLFAHRTLGTWSDQVDLFIALSDFARRKLIECGITAEKIALKPNFVHPDPGPSSSSGSFALFVGRLSSEKGIEILLDAWNRLDSGLMLRVVGTGPLVEKVEKASSESEAIEYLGQKPSSEVMDLMAEISFLIVPSICYETFGLAIVEAFAKARPVIVPRLGAMQELVREGWTGLHFESGEPSDLAAKVAWAIEHPREMQVMGQNARSVYEENYGAERNYQRLMEIYASALALSRRGHD